MHSQYLLGDIGFEIPSTWSVNEINDIIEVVDAKNIGALHLSILKRTKIDAVNKSDAKLLIDNFTSNNKLMPDDVSVTFKMRPEEVRAIGSFRPVQPAIGIPSYWLVGCVI